MPCGVGSVHISLGNGFVSDIIKPLSALMMIYHPWCPVAITWGQFHKKYLSRQSLNLACKLILNISFNLSNELNDLGRSTNVCKRQSMSSLLFCATAWGIAHRTSNYLNWKWMKCVEVKTEQSCMKCVWISGLPVSVFKSLFWSREYDIGWRHTIKSRWYLFYQWMLCQRIGPPWASYQIR